MPSLEKNHSLVSIILVTYNGQEFIEDCLESIFKQTYNRLELLIIDNNSKDKTRKFLEQVKAFRLHLEINSVWNRTRLKVIYNKKNIGFAQAHNQGIKQTQGEYICCLNQDVILDKNFIAQALKPFRCRDKVAAVQGRVLRATKETATEELIDTVGLVMLRNRRIINQGQGETALGKYNISKQIFGADGACPVYRREALEDVKIEDQYFDGDFFCYKEDVDLAWRLRLTGWQTIYQPRALAWHWRGSGDSAARSPWQIVLERRKINQFSKSLSFRNQRLMQLKNEIPILFIRDLPWILFKEIGAWFYVILFERYTWSAILDIFKNFKKTLKKRKLVMAKRKISTKEMAKWFK